MADSYSFKNYLLADLIENDEHKTKRMSLVRFDERPFYPRMKVDANHNMFFEIVDKKKDKVVNTFAIHELTDGNRIEFDNFCESTDIYVKKD